MSTYMVATDYNNATSKRDRLLIWSGAFASDFEGWATERPGRNGYVIEPANPMVHGKVWVDTLSPRDDLNFERVDADISAALVLAWGRPGGDA